MEGSDDVYVHKFSISMGGKTLFNDCKLSLVHGRRYGLIGVTSSCFFNWTAVRGLGWQTHAIVRSQASDRFLARRFQDQTAVVRAH